MTRISATFLLGAAAVLALAPTVGRRLRPAAAGPSDGAAAPTPAVVAAASAPAKEPITARPVSVSETRERTVGDTPGQPSSALFFTGLRVKLRLEGPAAAGASKVGRLKITEAADDAGTDLRDKDQLKWGEQFQDVSRFGQSDKDKAAGGFEYEMKLGLPARKAGAIARLKGELQVLSGGEEKTVSVPAVRKLAGKAVEDPALKAAGITLKVLPSPAGGAEELGAGGAVGRLRRDQGREGDRPRRHQPDGRRLVERVERQTHGELHAQPADR